MIGLDLEGTGLGEERGVVNVNESVRSRVASLRVDDGHGELVVVKSRGCDAIHAGKAPTITTPRALGV